MSTSIAYKSLHSKPAEVKFPIPLKAGELERLMKYFQAKAEPVLYFLHKDLHTSEYYFTNSKGDLVSVHNLPSVCAFVILKNEEDHLELILGEGNHGYIARGAKESYAAGDIYFDTDVMRQLPPDTIYFDIQKLIKKITDQSGGYHISSKDPLLQEKRLSARAAMETCGLPVHKLEYFIEPDLMSLCNPITQEAIRKISEIFQTSDTAQTTESFSAPQKPLIFSDGPNKDLGHKAGTALENADVLLSQQLMKIKPTGGSTAPAA